VEICGIFAAEIPENDFSVKKEVYIKKITVF
jgi:hypothetical protein